MRIVHVPYSFMPDPVGGTEVYVESLAKAQQALGLNPIIVAPGATENHYEHAGLNVRRFLSGPAENLDELYGEGSKIAAQSFARILDDECPEVVHLHSFTSASSLLTVREARRRGCVVVLTYHTPTVSCVRGTLLRWGKQICDGVVRRTRCAACFLQSRGLLRPAAHVLSLVPRKVGAQVGSLGLTGRGWTALRMSQLMDHRCAAFRDLMREVDCVISLCQWSSDLLAANGVDLSKIKICRHGIRQLRLQAANDHNKKRRSADPLKMLFLGRLDPTKGLDILLQALRLIPEAHLRLDVFGVIQQHSLDDYLLALKEEINKDGRVMLRSPAEQGAVLSVLKPYDVLVVPSQWLETGPLVVLEAFAAGVPILGSDLGGIRELVTHGTNGLLVRPDSAHAWAEAIQYCVNNPDRLRDLKMGIPAVRSMEDVAREHLVLYRSLRPVTAPEMDPIKAVR